MSSYIVPALWRVTMCALNTLTCARILFVSHFIVKLLLSVHNCSVLVCMVCLLCMCVGGISPHLCLLLQFFENLPGGGGEHSMSSTMYLTSHNSPSASPDIPHFQKKSQGTHGRLAIRARYGSCTQPVTPQPSGHCWI